MKNAAKELAPLLQGKKIKTGKIKYCHDCGGQLIDYLVTDRNKGHVLELLNFEYCHTDRDHLFITGEIIFDDKSRIVRSTDPTNQRWIYLPIEFSNINLTFKVGDKEKTQPAFYVNIDGYHDEDGNWVESPFGYFYTAKRWGTKNVKGHKVKHVPINITGRVKVNINDVISWTYE